MPSGIDLRDLGEHRLKDLTRPERVAQVTVPDLRSDFSPLASLNAYSHNLPIHPTALLGRERAVAEVCAFLRGGARLVTLTGPGGTGKTRLSLQVAAELPDSFDHGVFLVELAPISDPALVPSTIAQVLGLRDLGGRPVLESLKEHLRIRSILLVLDNFEQILPAAPVVADLLATSPGLRVLVTSREPLRLRGEREYAVPPLTLPDAPHRAAPETLSQYAAVALFLERAVAIRSDFTVTRENAPAVAEICTRLDGLPLAIELAAARVRLLTPQAMVGRLGRRLPLLTGGARDLPTRQQTLRGAITWSYDLLNDPERRLFRRLAVFVGGWTLEAAEAVCGVGDSDDDVLDGLDLLVSKSLVRQHAGPDSTPRFTMLETIREYGLEQLQLSGELELLSRKHAAHYLDLAEEARTHFDGPDQARWLDRLERDHDNLHAAVRWAIERKDAELGIRLVRNLAGFWYFRGYYSGGRALREAVLALPAGPELAGLRAQLLQANALLAQQQGDYAAARAFVGEALVIARRVGDPVPLTHTLITLGFVTRVQGDYAVARSALEEGLTRARDAVLPGSTAMALHHLGLLAWEADRDGDVAWSLHEQSLALYRGQGNRRGVGVVLWGQARVARARGDAAGAHALVAEALTAHGEVGDTGVVPQMLYVLAALDADAGRLERAVRVAAASATWQESIGSRAWPVILRERDAWLGPARPALGDEAFARAWAEGQAMTREQAVAYALEGSGQA
jgi:predicted ATPase